MSRKVNFRPSDVTSVFNYPKPSKYIERLFQKGDENIPKKIQIEKPILNIQTHNMLAFSEPIWKGLAKKIHFLEIVRHPAFMINQIYTSAIGDLINNPRNWTIHVKFNKGVFPFYVNGYAEHFSKANIYERAVLFINNYSKSVKSFKIQNNKTKKELKTISFEKFIQNPDGYIQIIGDWLKTNATAEMGEVLRKANVPREKISDVPDIEVYKKSGGWSKSSNDFNDRDEINMNIKFIKNNVSKDIFKLFQNVCEEYEESNWSPKQ